MNQITKITLFYFLFLINCFGEEPFSFINGTGKTFGSARSSASKVAISQGMKIIGQDYYKDNNGNYNIVLKVKKNTLIIK